MEYPVHPSSTDGFEGDERLRVLHVLLDPRIGGIQTRIAMIAPSLRASGIESLAIIPKGASAGKDLLERAGIRTKSMSFGLLIPTLMELSREEKLLWIPKFVLFPISLMREMRGSDIDIVHVNGLLGMRAVIAARVCGKKVIWHLVGTHYPKSLVLLWQVALRNLPDLAIFLSEQTARFYLGGRERKSSELIVREAVDVDYLSRDKMTDLQIKETRKNLRIEADERVIVFIGNLNRAKGIETLLDALAALVKTTSKVKLIISGQTMPTQMSYKEFLDKKVKKFGLDRRAEFIGRYPDLRGLLRIATVFVLPSIAEGTPIVVMEAMSMGVPVVASNVGGIPDLVRDGETGLLVNPDDSRALSDAIRRLLEDPVLRATMGMNARKISLELFSKQRCVKEHLMIYEHLGRKTDNGRT